MDILFNKTVNMLSSMLDYRSKRHPVILSNVANIDTAGFKPSDMAFQNELSRSNKVQLTATDTAHIQSKQRQMTTTDPAHITRKDSKPGAVPFEMITSDENVKLDTEMANLAENHLMYNTTVEMLARKFRGINTVLKETK
jgi:flagellar basal-body rod protein FlgB